MNTDRPHIERFLYCYSHRCLLPLNNKHEYMMTVKLNLTDYRRHHRKWGQDRN